MSNTLSNKHFMAFPFRMSKEGCELSSRSAHIRAQIEQVLFTDPGERWYRPEFGIGVRSMIFEPNNPGLWEITKKRLLATLSDVLAGEVIASSLEIDVRGEEEKLFIIIGYTLAKIRHSERVEFVVGGQS